MAVVVGRRLSADKWEILCSICGKFPYQFGYHTHTHTNMTHGTWYLGMKTKRHSKRTCHFNASLFHKQYFGLNSTWAMALVRMRHDTLEESKRTKHLKQKYERRRRRRKTFSLFGFLFIYLFCSLHPVHDGMGMKSVKQC